MSFMHTLSRRLACGSTLNSHPTPDVLNIVNTKRADFLFVSVTTTDELSLFDPTVTEEYE